MNQLVSLVTPVYNAMPWFEAYLESVLKQSWRPLQFIVVDDGSTDGSFEYLCGMDSAFKTAGIDLQIIRIPHAGQAAAVNAALPYIRGSMLSWCDADDALTTDSLEKKAVYLIAHPDLGMVRSDGWVISGTEKKHRRAAVSGDCLTQNIFDALFHQTTYCYAGGYMLRTELFLGCYPEKQITLSPEGQNLQLLLPPASRTKCGFIADPLFCYYIRPGSHSNRRRSYTEQLARIENFAKLRAEILAYCECDRQRYLLENEKICLENRRQLLYSVLVCVRKELKR